MLLALVGLFLLSPLSPYAPISFPLFTFLFLMLIFFTLRIMDLKKSVFRGLLAVAVFAFVIDWILALKQVEVFYSSFVIILYSGLVGFSIVFLIYQLLMERRITADTVMGGISIYILIGILWTLFFQVVYIYNPNAFDISNMGYGKEENFFYFSFVTLTTLGYGDILPLSRIARTLSTAEAVLGQIYLTVFVAHLVGFYIAHKLKK